MTGFERFLELFDRWAFLGIGASAAGAAVLGIKADGATGSAQTHLEIWLAVVVLAGVLLGAVRERRQRTYIREIEELAEEYRAQLGITLGNVIVSIAALIGRAHAAPRGPKRKELRGQLQSKILASAARLCGGEGIRATFYRHESDQAQSDLVMVDFEGRPDKPRERFRRGTSQQANRVFDLVDAGAVDRCDDTMDKADKDAYTGKKYRSWCAAAVSAAGIMVGFLVVDSTDVAAFTEGHEQVMQALAELLGAGLAG